MCFLSPTKKEKPCSMHWFWREFDKSELKCACKNDDYTYIMCTCFLGQLKKKQYRQNRENCRGGFETLFSGPSSKQANEYEKNESSIAVFFTCLFLVSISSQSAKAALLCHPISHNQPSRKCVVFHGFSWIISFSKFSLPQSFPWPAMKKSLEFCWAFLHQFVPSQPSSCPPQKKNDIYMDSFVRHRFSRHQPSKKHK